MTISASALEQIDRIGLSRVASHDRACCYLVRHGVFAQFASHANAGSALAAIPEMFRWGPVRWPAHWCGLAKQNGLVGDCGVHADVASAVLEQFAIPHTRGRVALLAPPLASAHWRAVWQEEEASDTWIGQTIVHHEVLHVGGRWWDPSGSRWFAGEGASLASGRVLAIREDNGQWKMDPASSEHFKP